MMRKNWLDWIGWRGKWCEIGQHIFYYMPINQSSHALLTYTLLPYNTLNSLASLKKEVSPGIRIGPFSHGLIWANNGAYF